MKNVHIKIKDTETNRFELEEIILAALNDEGYDAEIYDEENEPTRLHLSYSEFPAQLKEIMESEGYSDEEIEKVLTDSSEIYAELKNSDPEDAYSVLRDLIAEKTED